MALGWAEPTGHFPCFLRLCPNCYEKDGKRFHLHHGVSGGISWCLLRMPFQWSVGFGLNLVAEELRWKTNQAELKGSSGIRQWQWSGSAPIGISATRVPKFCLNPEVKEYGDSECLSENAVDTQIASLAHRQAALFASVAEGSGVRCFFCAQWNGICVPKKLEGISEVTKFSLSLLQTNTM